MSWAPRGPPNPHRKPRKKPSHILTRESPLAKSAVVRIHNTCSVRRSETFTTDYCAYNVPLQTALHSRLGWTENALFLEQFRYIIVASQLLNEHSNHKSYRRQAYPVPQGTGASQWRQDQTFIPSRLGLSLTGVTAFILAWSVRWLQSRATVQHDPLQICLLSSAILVIALTLYYYFRRQWLHYLRIQAIEGASSLITNAQEFDAAVSAGITFVQEVELVSRGYKMWVTGTF